MPRAALAYFRRSVVEEWSDEWDDASIEVLRFTRSDVDEPLTYEIRGRNLTINDLRQSASWILGLTDELPDD
jgi:hypothetical protein